MRRKLTEYIADSIDIEYEYNLSKSALSTLSTCIMAALKAFEEDEKITIEFIKAYHLP